MMTGMMAGYFDDVILLGARPCVDSFWS